MTTALNPSSSTLPSSTVAPPRRTQSLPLAATAIASAVTPKPATPTPVTPVTPVKPAAAAGAVNPVTPGAVKPVMPVSPGGVNPIKPITPGAVSPVSPVKPSTPGATTLPVTPTTPGKVPLKPSAAVPAAHLDPNKKSGTSVIKTAPPKETARITVKPSLPGARPVGASPMPVAAAIGATAAAGALGAAAVKAGSSPAVKPADSKAKPAPAPNSSAPATSAGPIKYVEEPQGSTLVTTLMAGGLAVLTWGIAIYLYLATSA
jgi:hypothetical protein